MINRAIIIFVLHACLLSHPRAQDSLASDTRHLLGLSTGLSNHMVRDDIISPLIYKGSQLPILLTYEYRGLTTRQDVKAFYSNLDLTSSTTNKATSSHYAANLNAFVEYSYARKAFLLEPLRTECFLGGTVGSYLNWRTFYYSSQTSETSLEAMVNCAVDVVLETRLDKASDNVLSFHVSVPLISYVLLNDRYNAKVSETFNELDLENNVFWQILTKGSVVTLNKLFKVQAELSYRTFMSESVGVECRYRFLYYSFAQYETLSHARCVNNQLLVGLIIAL